MQKENITREVNEETNLTDTDLAVCLICEKFDQWCEELVSSKNTDFKEEGTEANRAFNTLVNAYGIPEHHAFRVAIAAFVGGFQSGASFFYELDNGIAEG